MSSKSFLPENGKNTFLKNKKWANPGVDGVLGIQTRGRRMVGADKTAELWRPPIPIPNYCCTDDPMGFPDAPG